MKSLIHLLSAVLVISLSATLGRVASLNSRLAPDFVSRTSIHGLRPGLPHQNVVRLVGAPERVIQGEHFYDWGGLAYYRDLTITVVQGDALEVDGESILQAGASTAQVYSTLGKPLGSKTLGGVTTLTYRGYGVQLSVTCIGEVVKEFEIQDGRCQLLTTTSCFQRVICSQVGILFSEPTYRRQQGDEGSGPASFCLLPARRGAMSVYLVSAIRTKLTSILGTSLGRAMAEL